MTTTKLEIPQEVKITVSKSAQVQSVVLDDGQKFYPGETVELTIGEELTVWTTKGRKIATVTDTGLVFAGLHADGSRQR